MQHLKLFTFAVVLAGCVLYAEGFATGGEQSQSTGFLSGFRNAATQASKAVWGSSGGAPKVDEADHPTATGTSNGTSDGGFVAGVSVWRSALYNGAAELGKTGVAKLKAGANYVTSPEVSQVLKKTASTVGTGLNNGVKQVKNAGVAKIKAGANYMTSPEVNQVLKKTTSTVGTGLYNVAIEVKNAGETGIKAGTDFVTSPEVNQALKETASTVGTGLYNGAREVKNAGEAGIKAGTDFVTSPEVNQALKKTASSVGTGLYNGAEVVRKAGLAGIKAGTDFVQSGGLDEILTSLGACAQFTLSSLATALSAVDYESLAKALGIDNIAKAIDDKIDVYGIFTKLILGQAKDPEDGGINYATATLVLQKLLEMVPPLKKTIDAFQTVFYVISKLRELKRENKPIDPATVMKEALNFYFKDVDPAFKKKLIELSPVVYKAATGVAEAAIKVVSTLADRGTIIEALKGIGFKNQVELIQAVVTLVVDCAITVKEQNAAKHAKK